MNKRLEQLIKTVNLTPGKTKFIILNGQQTSKQDGYHVLEILKARGHTDATVLMVDGDVRSATGVYELESGDEQVKNGSVSES